jgi:DNA-directed RNA polymerase, mitochondrial
MPTINDQIALEHDSVLKGYQRFMDRHEALRSQDLAGETKVGQEIQYLLVGEVTGHIRAMVSEAQASRGGRPERWLPLVKDLDPAALAVEALSAAWSAAAMSKPLQHLLVTMGRHAEVHAEVQALQGALGPQRARAAMKTVVETKARVQSRMKAVASKARKVGHTEWTVEQRAYVGGMLWNALCLTGLFETWNTGSDRSIKFVGLTTTGEHLALETTHALAWARPVLLPTIVPPKPWQGLKGGGYFTKELQARVPLVRTRCKDHRKALSKAVKDGSLAPVIRAVNEIQGTGFQIRLEVRDLAGWAWKKSLALKKFPSRTRVTPSLPWDLEYMDVKEKARHLAQYYKAQRFNRGIGSNAAAMRRDLETAQWLSEQPEFYLPCSLDFRGRVYPVPSFNHQRSDYVKGMFRFSKGKRLGSSGLYWLQVHVANCGDFDKVSKKSFDDRVTWVHDNLDLIHRVAADPRTNLEWVRADKPFSFYHACLELTEALSLENPEDYVSHIPVDLDGSNSGVQHYAAALRGEEGVLVNLTPSDRPADLYASVASKVKAYAETVAQPGPVDPEAYRDALVALGRVRGEAGAEEARAVLEPMVARLWLDYGISRSEVKRPTMTRGYGSETFGFRSQIIEDLMEPLSIDVMTGKRPAHPFGYDEGKEAASWMAKRIWDALAAILVKTSEGMDYLQKVARVLAQEGHGVAWTTSLGFPVVQRYEEEEVATVALWLHGREAEVPNATQVDHDDHRGPLRRYRMSLVTGTTGELVKHRQANAVAPNFIHSQDATHLLASVLRAADNADIHDFVLVHDSFGTHAANIEVFGKVIREAFVDLYENQDVFQAFHEAAEASLGSGATQLPPVPQKGSLDLLGVLEARYTFA